MYLLCDFKLNHLKTASQIGVCSCVSLSREKMHLFSWQISNFGTNLELILHMRTFPIHYLVLASIWITETKLIEE